MEERCIKLNFKILEIFIDLSYVFEILKTLNTFFDVYIFLPEIVLLLLVLYIIIFDNFINLSVSTYLVFYAWLQYYNLKILDFYPTSLFFKTIEIQYITLFLTLFSIFIGYLINCTTEIKSLYILLIIFLNLMLSASNLLSFYICMESVSFCVFLLSVVEVKTAIKIESTIKYFVITVVSSSLFLLSTSLIF
jgi:NADH:ubiquinone oxidoreductase subunit 2 (subunit N)